MADKEKEKFEESPQQGNLLNELETMYKKISEEKLADPGSSKDAPPDPENIKPESFQPDLPYGDDHFAGPPKKKSVSTAKIFLYSVPLILIAAFALFIWPTPYHYGALKQGGRIYLVKTNRLTDSKSYFYAGKWMNAPLPETADLRLPDPLSIKSQGDVPAEIKEPSAPLKTAPDMKGAPEPAIKQVKEPEKESAKAPPLPTPAAQGASKAEIRPEARPETRPEAKPIAKPESPAEPRPTAVQVQKTEPSPPKRTATRAEKQTPKKKAYAVQIRAFQSREELNRFLADEKGGGKMHWAKVQVGNGTWYRVFMGRFADQEEARRYIEKHQIKAAYPGSFVQKIN